MIKKRIIPTLVYKDHGLVKSKKFSEYRFLGDPIQAINVYNIRDVDEVFFVDISEHSVRPNLSLIDEVLSNALMPVTVGGGITKISDISNLLSVGADKICISYKAYENNGFIQDIIEKYGSQVLVVSVDYTAGLDGNYYLVFNPGNRKYKINIVEHIRMLAGMGVSEIILTSVDRDGQMNGYDIELMKSFVDPMKVGIVLNGGAGNYRHMLSAFENDNVVAVAASSMFQFTDCTPKEASMFLGNNNVAVRI